MKASHIKLITIFSLYLFANNIFSQSEIIITNLEEKDEKLIIRYDILKYNQEDLFEVYIEIITSSGDIVKPKHVTGDINKKLTGKKGYEIIWDLAADGIFINEDVDIQIGADISTDIYYLNYSSLMLSSTLMPGMGLKKIERKNSYLFLGLLGYGAIATSVYFYTEGHKSYKNYEVENDPIKRSELYDLSIKNDQNAKIAGISAAGIWVINYIWFSAKWKNKKNKTASVFKRKFGFYANYHPSINKTMFSLSYKF